VKTVTLPECQTPALLLNNLLPNVSRKDPFIIWRYLKVLSRVQLPTVARKSRLLVDFHVYLWHNCCNDFLDCTHLGNI